MVQTLGQKSAWKLDTVAMDKGKASVRVPFKGVAWRMLVPDRPGATVTAGKDYFDSLPVLH